jgi:hypothetical protein
MRCTLGLTAALLAVLSLTAQAAPLSEQTIAGMRKAFEQYPEKFPAEVQRAFMAQRVVPGMDPYTAHMAGGAFIYRVVADPLKWPSGSDPFRVMWAQSMHPDHSKIWMTFENDTQFAGEGKQRFIVVVEEGKVVRVEKIQAR